LLWIKQSIEDNLNIYDNSSHSGGRMKTLWELKAKQAAVVETINSQLTGPVISRLQEMGFSKGQQVVCVRRSPFKGPLVVQVGDCVYSLEQAVAEKINLALAS
tara:strand:+ start:1050 stop:1358 length:309 start_codon:yes stop_codon:yes gene_type:complete